MSFSRWWTETTAALGDHVPLPLLALLLVVAAVLAALAWHTFPAWVPRRLPRIRLPRIRRPRLPRFRRRRRPERKAATATEPTALAPLPPDTPGTAHLSLADRLAAEGRYAEAVRERLRDMIGELVSRQVVPRQPGLTVLEVGATAARNRPPTGPPVAAAGAIFAELWYAQRPASAEHDRRMRELAGDLHRLLAEPSATTGAPAAAPGPDSMPGPGGVPGPDGGPATVPGQHSGGADALGNAGGPATRSDPAGAREGRS
ncbi:DUF4129 domain-containing protein [Micromonospora sp. NPDC048909]|uniref:DUF4129 domain-containing protein n=1 Tax=Micromonospora sp. NPDC048909 TaxID=3155643 RepID=UPI0033D7E770